MLKPGTGTLIIIQINNLLSTVLENCPTSLTTLIYQHAGTRVLEGEWGW